MQQKEYQVENQDQLNPKMAEEGNKNQRESN
jgi:hypothetical protein